MSRTPSARAAACCGLAALLSAPLGATALGNTSAYYGTGLNADGTSSLTLGGASAIQVDFRFRASAGASLSALRAHFTNKVGTGGSVKVTLRADDGSSAHLPGASLAAASLTDPAASGGFARIAFPTPATLASGQLYHLVFTNTDAAPAANGASLSVLWTNGQPSPMQPVAADLDWSALQAYGAGAWGVVQGGTPVLGLEYAGGASQGQGFVEAWSGNPKSISGPARVSERFTLSGSARTANLAYVRVKRVSGGSPLELRLENGSGGLLTSGSVAASAVPAADGWVAVPFAAPVSLAPGSSYRLVLGTTADSAYSTFALRDGAAFGFAGATTFPDGNAEVDTGSGWTGWDMWGVANRTDGDLQFRLVNAPAGTGPTGTAPAIDAFYAADATVVSGNGTTLSWSAPGATRLSLSGVGDVTGTPMASVSPADTTTYTLTASNPYGTATKAVTVTVVPPPPPSSGSPFYGNALNADSLGNTQIGGPQDHHPSYRFKAGRSAALKAVRAFLVWDYTKAGYHGGTGGQVKVTLRADDGSASHLPGATLATVLLADPLAGSKYPLFSFPAPVPLVEGQYYHLSFSNPDPDPATNFVSVNGLYMSTPLAPRQPCFDNMEWTQLDHDVYTAAWYTSTHITPILELDWSDGRSGGVGYMEVWVAAARAVAGAASVRERFTVTGVDRYVDTASVRVRRTSGASPLTLRLEESDGTLIDQGTVPASEVGSTNVWVTAAFSQVRTLYAGHTYNLVLSSPADTVYSAFPIREGNDYYGWAPGSVFTDGLAQYTTGTGWTGWNIWGTGNRPDGDLQFYFHVMNP